MKKFFAGVFISSLVWFSLMCFYHLPMGFYPPQQKLHKQEMRIFVGFAPELAHPAETFSSGFADRKGNFSVYSFKHKRHYEEFVNGVREYSNLLYQSMNFFDGKD